MTARPPSTIPKQKNGPNREERRKLAMMRRKKPLRWTLTEDEARDLMRRDRIIEAKIDGENIPAAQMTRADMELLFKSQWNVILTWSSGLVTVDGVAIKSTIKQGPDGAVVVLEEAPKKGADVRLVTSGG